MEVKAIRLNNLLTLLSRYKTINEFCEFIEMEPSYLSQIKGGRKSIGDRWARRLESKFGMELGELDALFPAQQPVEREPEADVMAVALAIESLPESIRYQLKNLIFRVSNELEARQCRH